MVVPVQTESLQSVYGGLGSQGTLLMSDSQRRARRRRSLSAPPSAVELASRAVRLARRVAALAVRRWSGSCWLLRRGLLLGDALLEAAVHVVSWAGSAAAGAQPEPMPFSFWIMVPITGVLIVVRGAGVFAESFFGVELPENIKLISWLEDLRSDLRELIHGKPKSYMQMSSKDTTTASSSLSTFPTTTASSHSQSQTPDFDEEEQNQEEPATEAEPELVLETESGQLTPPPESAGDSVYYSPTSEKLVEFEALESTDENKAEDKLRHEEEKEQPKEEQTAEEEREEPAEPAPAYQGPQLPEDLQDAEKTLLGGASGQEAAAAAQPGLAHASRDLIRAEREGAGPAPGSSSRPTRRAHRRRAKSPKPTENFFSALRSRLT